MKHRRISLAIAATTTLGLAATAAPATATADVSTVAKAGTTSLATVLDADGDRFDNTWGDFDIADRAIRTVLDVKPTSDVRLLADGSVPLTAFVPTDRAFRHLVGDLTGARPATERGTFKKLGAAVDVATLETVLLYHVVPGATITYAMAEGSDDASLPTAAPGESLTVNVQGHAVRLRDADTDDRNPRVIRDLRNINKGNEQIAHGINRVLRPFDLP